MNLSQIDGPYEFWIFDAEGNPSAIEPGCHVNIAAWDMQPEFEPYRIYPEQPQRVWAGDEPPYPQTIFLLFADEAEMRRVLSIADIPPEIFPEI